MTTIVFSTMCLIGKLKSCLGLKKKPAEPKSDVIQDKAESKPDADEEKVKDRLKSLGYLD